MKKLILESEKDSNSVDKSRGNSIGSSESKKRKAEIEFIEENHKKSKTVASELNRLIGEAQNLNNYETLEAKIKEIDKYQGEPAYDLHQGEINQLKTNLGNLDSGKFKVGRVKAVEKLLEDSGIKVNDLDSETKNFLSRLKNEQDVSKINQLENKVSDGIGKQGAISKLNQLLKKAQEVIDKTVKFTVEQVQQVKKDLSEFYYGSNRFNSSALEKGDNRSKTKNMLEAMENQLQSNPNSTSGLSPTQKTVLGIAIGAVAIGVLGMVV